MLKIAKLSHEQDYHSAVIGEWMLRRQAALLESEGEMMFAQELRQACRDQRTVAH